MSDKNVAESQTGVKNALANLETKLAAAQAALEKGKQVAARLHPTLQPDDFYLTGYCGDATIQFNPAYASKIDQLIQAYPPVSCVVATGDSPTVKPEKALRANERGAKAFPLRIDTHAGKSKVVWWFEKDDMTLTVEMPGTLPESALPNAACWELKSISYNSGHGLQYWVPRQKRAADIKRLTPTEQWEAVIDQWVAAAAYRSKSLSLPKYFTAKARYTTDVIEGPKPNQYAKCTYEDWVALSQTEKDEYIAFFTERQQAWQQVPEAEQAQVDEAKAWLEAFFATHGPIAEETLSETAVTTLCYLLKANTNTSAILHWINRTHRNGPFEVAVTLKNAHVRFNPTHDMTQPALNLDALAEYYS